MSNFIIVTMLISLCLVTFNVNNNYVFSSNNPEVIYHGNENSNKITFLINVYWGNNYIEDMLKVFDEYDVKTTFFIGGSWASKYPDLLEKIHNSGHEIANHGYHHRDQDKLNYEQNVDEISKCHQVIKQLINVDMNLFMAPSGAFSKNTINACTDQGYKMIMWTRDTIDWRDHDANTIYNRAVKNAKGGDIILAHPTESTLQALPRILEKFKDMGLKATTLSDNLAII